MTDNKYTILEVRPDGTEVRRYPDGSIRDQKGYMLEPLPGNKMIVTSERGSELSRGRWEAAREQAVLGMIEGVGLDPKHASGTDAWRKIVKHTVQTYMKSANIRGMAEIFGKLGQATGFLGRDEEAPADTDTKVFTNDTIARVLEIIEKALDGNNREPIDGKVSDPS